MSSPRACPVCGRPRAPERQTCGDAECVRARKVAAGIMGGKASHRPRSEVCPAGHAMIGDNAVLRASGSWACRACQREWTRRWRAGR